MKHILSKVMNKYVVGLFATFVSTSALAQQGGGLFANMTPGTLALGALGIAAIVGVAAVVTQDSDDGVS